jgi:hypothetical protein
MREIKCRIPACVRCLIDSIVGKIIVNAGLEGVEKLGFNFCRSATRRINSSSTNDLLKIVKIGHD